MKITSVEAGRFMLDGGAMFGVVPKRIWNRLNPSDDENMCPWTMRSLLIETGDRKILVDCGIGFKQGEKFRSHFYPHGMELEDSLSQKGIQPEEITDVFITHFHFDHVGGALEYRNDKIQPTFPNATYWSNEVHYNYAYDPNAREKASFLKENFVPLKEQKILQFIDYQTDDVEWLPGIKVRFVEGHTTAQMILIIDQANEKTVFCADLIPSAWHIPLPYIMAYDMKPMITLEEKIRLLDEARENSWNLVFEHDPNTEKGKVIKDDKG
ncbi:MAG: MBL fold metallo-hydrolase, partial [Saprospiraceae bacterium]|nr:MBL fold metallo-hydrolase [Saprospiraceae bacterium]